MTGIVTPEPGGAWLRSFLAISLPDDIRTALLGCIVKLRKAPVRVAWVRREQLHITLTFHGNQPVERLELLSGALPAILADQETFGLTVHGAGCFGSPHSPRILWAGIGKGSEQLVRLQAAITAAGAAAGIEQEKRPYHPHVTLGRVRRADSAGRRVLRDQLQSFKNRCFGTLQVDQVVLMRSEPTSCGMRYSVMATMPLQQ